MMVRPRPPVPPSDPEPEAASSAAQEAVWVAITIAFVVLVLTTRVETYLGSRGRGRAVIWTIWRDLAADLPGGGTGAVKTGYVLVIALFALGSLGALWLALSGPESSPDETPNEIDHVVAADAP